MYVFCGSHAGVEPDDGGFIDPTPPRTIGARAMKWGSFGIRGPNHRGRQPFICVTEIALMRDRVFCGVRHKC